MSPKYTIRKHEEKHLVEINRIHLACEWNHRVEAMDAKLSFRNFARQMHIPESIWCRDAHSCVITLAIRSPVPIF